MPLFYYSFKKKIFIQIKHYFYLIRFLWTTDINKYLDVDRVINHSLTNNTSAWPNYTWALWITCTFWFFVITTCVNTFILLSVIFYYIKSLVYCWTSTESKEATYAFSFDFLLQHTKSITYMFNLWNKQQIPQKLTRHWRKLFTAFLKGAEQHYSSAGWQHGDKCSTCSTAYYITVRSHGTLASELMLKVTGWCHGVV